MVSVLPAQSTVLSAEPPLLLIIEFMLIKTITCLLHKAVSVDGPGQFLVC